MTPEERDSFREYLRNKFAAQYEGFDDEMPDAESEWFEDLDIDTVIDYAEAWLKERISK